MLAQNRTVSANIAREVVYSCIQNSPRCGVTGICAPENVIAKNHLDLLGVFVVPFRQRACIIAVWR
jgi:hypothetical protein